MTDTPADTTETSELRCSFCDQQSSEAFVLIKGQSACICETCAIDSTRIVIERTRARAAAILEREQA